MFISRTSTPITLIISIVLILSAGTMAHGGSISPVITIPVVAVFHYAGNAQGEVVSAVSLQVEHRDDQASLRVVMNHRPGMVDTRYAQILETAMTHGLPSLGFDTRGLTVTINFAGPFMFKGGSLSAAVVIGAVAALESRPLTPNMVITGTVEPDGSLGPIAELETKIAGAGTYTVLYPAAQETTMTHVASAHPVRNLQEATLYMLQ